MNVASLLAAQVDRHPHAPAVVDAHRGRVRATTFVQLEIASRRGAALLRAAGLRPGDRVLLLHPMAAELYVALLSVLRLGLVAVVIDPSMGRDDVNGCCAKARPAAFVGSPKAHLLRLLSPAVRRIPRHFALGGRVPGTVAWHADSSMATDVPLEGVDAAAPALLTFTSGSTGRPKGVLRTHGFLRAQYTALQQVLELQPGQVDLITLPIVMLANLAAGVTSVIPDVDLRRPGSVNPGSVARTIEDHRVTRVAAPPALLERLVDHCSASARTLPGLERVCTGGGPVLPGLLERVQRIAPRADVLAIYGSSEAEPIASLAYAGVSEADRRTMQSGGGLLAGIPVPAVRLRIVPDADQRPPIEPRAFEDWCLPHGQAGEILVSGPHVLTGYLDGEGDEATKLRIGDDVWHRTGDAGLLDEVGRLWLLGRCAAAARDARGTLYPFAVECAALQHPNVRRAALVASRGRRTLAVELRDPRDSSCLAALRTMLIWADLDAICDYGRLPLDRRHNSKIDYLALGRLVDSLPATPGG